LGVKANKTKRLRDKLQKYIQNNGPKTSRQLLDYFNSVSRQGSTMNSMTNVLAKDPRFRVHHKVMVRNIVGGGRYEMLVWGLNGEEEE